MEKLVSTGEAELLGGVSFAPILEAQHVKESALAPLKNGSKRSLTCCNSLVNVKSSLRFE